MQMEVIYICKKLEYRLIRNFINANYFQLSWNIYKVMQVKDIHVHF